MLGKITAFSSKGWFGWWNIFIVTDEGDGEDGYLHVGKFRTEGLADNYVREFNTRHNSYYIVPNKMDDN